MKIFQAKNIPNLLSVFRILLIPVYVILFLQYFPNGLYLSGLVFLLAGLTDVLDGYLARRNHWVSNVGKLLDPLADKLIEVAALVLLAVKWGGVFVGLAVVALLKELIMIVAAYVIVVKAKVFVMSMWFGKLTTLLLYVEVLVVSFFSASISSTVRDIMSIVVIVSMFATFVLYYVSYRQSIKKALSDAPGQS